MTNDRLTPTTHYVIARSPPDKLGAVKLNKVLWYADLTAYRRTGRTITGSETYIKRQYGPVPDGIIPTISRLENEQKIFVRTIETPAGPRREFLWLKQPDVKSFSSDEIDVLNEVMDWICNDESAKSISEKTHDILWEETEIGGRMSVKAGAIVPAEITPEAIAWAEGAFASA
jgi:antitoxin SocA-like protein